MRSRLVLALVLPWLALPARPVLAASGFEITAAQVAGAIRNSGISISDGQVHLLSNVVARTGAPVLQVDSMLPMGSQKMMVRLSCVEGAECLPFDVTVRTGQIPIAGIRRSQRTVVSGAAAVSALAPAPAPGQPPPANASGKSFLVRSGSPATLLLEGDKVHIRLLVVCLENGVAGQWIRVARKGNGKVFTAEVESPGVLRGSL